MLWADELLFLFTRKLFIFLGDKHSVVISIKMQKRCCKKENLIRKKKLIWKSWVDFPRVSKAHAGFWTPLRQPPIEGERAAKHVTRWGGDHRKLWAHIFFGKVTH